jgi:palmitoyltransferase
MFLAAVYSNIYHFSFVLDRLGHLGRVGMPICITVPHVCAIFGFLSLYEFLIAMLTFVAGMLMVVLAWLAVIQAVLVVHGQTRHERKKRDVIYDNGVMQNVRSVFGERWYVAWIWPWISSPLPENGVIFKITNGKSK